MEAQPTEFPLFPLFPPETRRQIWFYCLPCRVVQKDDPFFIDHIRRQQKCWSTRSIRRNAAPPLIASVCRESRQVVRQWGKMLKQDHYLNLGPVWIQPLLDVYNLNYTHTCSRQGNDVYLLKEFLEEGFCRLDMIPLSVTSEFFFPISLKPLQRHDVLPEYPYLRIQERGEEWPRSDATYHGFATLLERPFTRVSQSAVLLLICIHATKEQAVDSGLFDLLLDAPIQLVDFDDEKRLRKFHALFEKGYCSHKQPEVSRIFACILAPGFQRQVQSWKEKVDWLMMANAWMRSKYRNRHYIPIDGDPSLVWEPPILDDQLLISMGREPLGHMNSFDDHHPWVKQAKKELPMVTPKIQFLLCTDECDVDGNLGMVRDIPVPSSVPSGRSTRVYADLEELP